MVRKDLKLIVANTFWTRFAGLMLKPPLAKGTGLVIMPCNSIHMCFMCFAIDAIYFDENYRILKIVSNLKPWSGLSACLKAKGVVEMTSGEAKRLGLTIGDILAIKK